MSVFAAVRIRVLIVAAVSAVAFALTAVPANAAQHTVEFGWSAKNTDPSPTAVYTNDLAHGSCELAPGTYQGDMLDETPRGFAFVNGDGNRRVQMSFAQSPDNRRMIGPDLHSVAKESIKTGDEFRGCPPGDVWDKTSPGDITFLGGNGSPHNTTRKPGYLCPSDYDDSEWIASPYYVPGASAGTSSEQTTANVYAFLHQEFHGLGASDPLDCGMDPGYPFSSYCTTTDLNCWMGAITFAHWGQGSSCIVPSGFANNIGACYDQQTGNDPANDSSASARLVAAINQKFTRDWGRVGYREHSNVIKGENQLSGYYYMLAAVSSPDASLQAQGTCVLRVPTASIGDPSAWRAWDGMSFSAQPSSPYTPFGDDPANHDCKPLPSVSNTLTGSYFLPWSLTYNTYLNRYMVLGQGAFASAQPADYNLYYSLSTDLLNWSTPQLMMRSPIVGDTTQCDFDPTSYAVTLDENDPAFANALSTDSSLDRNFDHPDRQSELFYKRHVRNPNDCTGTVPELDRLPFKLEQRRATINVTLMNTSGASDNGDVEYAYDIGGANMGGGSSFTRANTPATGGPSDDYEHDGAAPHRVAKAVAGPGGSSTGAYGTINANNLKEGDDFWAGSAFWLESGFTMKNSTVDMLRWQTGTPGATGGIQLRPGPDNNYRVYVANGGSPTYIGDPAGFSIPEAQWAWVELHQKLSSTAGSALTEVYVNGHLVMSSSDANMTSGQAPINQVRYGFVTRAAAEAGEPLGSGSSTMYLDRSSLTAAQLGAIGAPATPIGFRAFGSAGPPPLISLMANSNGWRIYRKSPGTNTWQFITQTTSQQPVWYDLTAVPCGTYSYRIASVLPASGGSPELESLPSAPVDANDC
jgi:hypothetical protein